MNFMIYGQHQWNPVAWRRAHYWGVDHYYILENKLTWLLSGMPRCTTMGTKSWSWPHTIAPWANGRWTVKKSVLPVWNPYTFLLWRKYFGRVPGLCSMPIYPEHLCVNVYGLCPGWFANIQISTCVAIVSSIFGAHCDGSKSYWVLHQPTIFRGGISAIRTSGNEIRSIEISEMGQVLRFFQC